ncbi:hypothetical protein MOC61_09350 [Bacillus inaquosorum]|uniref:hypothetical protein n=1 Tax=Bacillus inaquosorum TaxID=483913 RepID=UPI00227F675C|nr:hypothetical protein [Bacillus inaquosorum]MCY7842257.1 hypothetical protein [Bacillus spizizenii]MCY8169598.1 hypothetical protein [Bacillus inaquosorum]MCY8358458.1 hypothetical protein [Bacillus inaquosorum]
MRGKAIYLTREEMRLIELCLDNVEPNDFIDIDQSPSEARKGFKADHGAYKAWHSVSDKIFKALREGAE